MKPSRVQFTADVLKKGLGQLKAGKVAEATTSFQEARQELMESGDDRNLVVRLVDEAFGYLRSGNTAEAVEQIAGAIWALENDYS